MHFELFLNMSKTTYIALNLTLKCNFFIKKRFVLWSECKMDSKNKIYFIF